MVTTLLLFTICLMGIYIYICYMYIHIYINIIEEYHYLY